MSEIGKLIKGILTGDIATSSLSKEQFEAVHAAMQLMKAKMLSPEQQKANREKTRKENNDRAFREARISKPAPKEPAAAEPAKKPSHLTVIKADLEKKTQEIVDCAPNGQWKLTNPDHIKDAEKKKLHKAIKPGPALDYGKMNPEANPISNPQAAKEAKAQRYADIEAKASTMDYQNNPATKPKYYTGAAEKAKAIRAKLEAESKETALDTFKRRGQMKDAPKSIDPSKPVAPAAPGTLKPTKKSEDGVLVDEEPSSSDKTKMVAKDESMGYGVAANTAPMQMSEKEPHMEDPKHEEKEKKKAKKIKEEAEEILDLHKNNKQWNID
jgi:hypothetical protein